jgi:hypothetical protein
MDRRRLGHSPLRRTWGAILSHAPLVHQPGAKHTGPSRVKSGQMGPSGAATLGASGDLPCGPGRHIPGRVSGGPEASSGECSRRSWAAISRARR